jgi:thiopurine S-methyltransferase
MKGQDDTLDAYWPQLNVPLGSRILLPLCGKSGDLEWLASRGYFPFGVEVATIPCQAFFAERSIDPDRTGSGAFTRWQGAGVTILQGDFFDLADTFDAAVDRGSLVAFPPHDRERYVHHLRSALVPGAPILLVTIEFDPERTQGPPYPVFPADIDRLFTGARHLARQPLRRPRWNKIGGAEAVVWAAKA